MRSHLVGRLVASAALLAGGATAVAATAAVTASPAAAQTGTGIYGGSATGNLVGVTAVTVPGATATAPPTLQVANVLVAPTTAQVSSNAKITAAPGKESYADATNLDADLISGAIPLNDLVVDSTQSALPDHPTAVTNTLASVPLDPVLDATVTSATANARWLGPDTCLPVGTDIAHGTSTVATANVLTNVGLGTATVSVVNSDGGPVTSDSSVKLISTKVANHDGVQSTQIDQLTGIVLFKGTSMELDINVVAPPEITATATGMPGGASITYTEPILQIYSGGTLVGTLDAATNSTSITIPAVATLTLGQLTNKVVAANGTSASGAANLLTVQVGVSPLPLNIATIQIAGASAAASVPVGGVNCPPATNPLSESHKDVSSSVVAAGQQFTYTVTVPNRGTCTLNPVKVVDTISAPAGTTVVSSTPAASSTNGLVLTYNNIGPLAPNQTDNIQITMQAPATLAAGTPFSNAAEITGLCEGAPSGTTPFAVHVTVSGPTGFVPAGPACHLDDSNKAADHLQVFPGESFNYYIHVLNDGVDPCTSVTITDTLGSGVTFVSATNGGTNSGGVVSWSLGTIASGASETVAVTVTATSTDHVGTNLPDTALIKSPSEPNGVTVSTNGPAVTTLSVLAPADPATPGSFGPLPRTGGQPLAPYGLALLIGGCALVVWRRRTRVVAS